MPRDNNSPTLTKSQFIEKFAEKLDEPIIKSKRYIDDILHLISELLRQNERVEFRGFGSFYLRKRAPRKVVTPLGSKLATAEKIVPRFRPSKELLSTLQTSIKETTQKTQGKKYATLAE